MEKVDKDVVESWIKQGHSYRSISHKLTNPYQNKAGIVWLEYEKIFS